MALNEAATVSVFQSRRPGGLGGFDIWISRRGGEGWSEPVNAGPHINSAQHELDASLSADGTTLLFTRSAYGGATAVGAAGPVPDKQTDLYISHWRNGAWGPAGKIPAPVSLAESAEFRPVLSLDGKRLFFGSNRQGGRGGYDIYATGSRNGRWETPVNLGAPVNSADDEVDVAVAPHGRTLILAKRPKPSDPQRIYISNLRGGAWSEPEDMGPRFNTGAGDGCPWLGYDGRTLYVNSSVENQFPFRRLNAGFTVWVFTYPEGF
ncbi:MAG: hypothetical protein ACKV22_39785 [Bryobacteraceae bacterium]